MTDVENVIVNNVVCSLMNCLRESDYRVFSNGIGYRCSKMLNGFIYPSASVALVSLNGKSTFDVVPALAIDVYLNQPIKEEMLARKAKYSHMGVEDYLIIVANGNVYGFKLENMKYPYYPNLVESDGAFNLDTIPNVVIKYEDIFRGIDLG